MYIDTLNQTLSKIKFEELNNIVDIIPEEQLIAIIGNGGSASTAEHLANDLSKKGYNAFALTNSTQITMYGNDIGYKNIFSEQVKRLKPKILIAISASGNSNNIIKAVTQAKKQGCIIVGFTGFDGGKLKILSDYNIHVPIKSYEIVEDIHLITSHMLTCKLLTL